MSAYLFSVTELQRIAMQTAACDLPRKRNQCGLYSNICIELATRSSIYGDHRDRNQSRSSCCRLLSEKGSGTNRRNQQPLASLSSNRLGSSGQRRRRRGCSSGRFVVSLETRRPVQRASEDVH